MELTKADRETVIIAALKETFAPRFDAFEKRLTEHVQELLLAEHPVFCEALNCPEVRRYLFATSDACVKANSEQNSPSLKHPAWRQRVGRNDPFVGLYTEAADFICVPVIRPAAVWFEPVASPELEEEYRVLWDKYLDAQDALVEAVYGYVSRENFVADFPGLAKHLPPVVSKRKALTVPAASIAAKLAVLGVAAQ